MRVMSVDDYILEMVNERMRKRGENVQLVWKRPTPKLVEEEVDNVIASSVKPDNKDLDYAQESLLILEELQVYQDDEYANGARTDRTRKKSSQRLRTRERLMSSGVIWLEGGRGLVSKGLLS